MTETQPSGFLNGQDTLGSPLLGATNTPRYDDSLGLYTIAVGTPDVVSANNNFGELVPATISGFVYIDANNNGLLASETGIVGVPMQLTGTDDQGTPVVVTGSTIAGGAYSFTGLRPGSYTVTETTQPTAYVDGLETRGNVSALAGTGNGSDVISAIALSAGQTAANHNFGEVPPSTVSGRVFSDSANDGTLNGNDAGIDNVILQLTGTDVNGNPVTRTTTTLANGTYSFTQLLAGTYTVTEVNQPIGYFDGQDSRNGVLLAGSIATDVINAISVSIGATAPNNDFAEVPEVDPVGYVYVDANVNGLHDNGEVGIPGVQITLTGIGNDVFGNPILPQTAFTDGNGHYQFSGLRPGRYTIVETQPANFTDGQEQNGTPAAASVTNDRFTDIDLINNAFGGDYNFGELSPTGSLSGAVYVDSNNNGIRDAGELGLGGVSITITDENNPANTATVVTDANGNYRFVKMFPGRYRLTQAQPVNFLDGRETLGTLGGTTGNDVFTTVNVGVNQAGTTYLFGEAGINPLRISKRLFLASAHPNVDFTGPAGSGVAAVSVPLADPSGYVYVDENRNGQYDAGEQGIQNAIVTLTGTTDTGKQVTNYVHTDATGFYQFAYLLPGVYALHETQPHGFADGPESLGTLGGVVGPDEFRQIVLKAGQIGELYNFGEYLAPQSEPGDANHDGIFNSSDLLAVFQAGEYEDGLVGNSTFEEGDWNGDGDFTTADLILALQLGSYQRSAADAIFAAWITSADVR